MKNILITGCSTGIGHSLAKDFVKRGYRVFGSVRKEQDASSLRDSLGEYFRPLIFDVTDEAAIGRALETVENEVGSEGLCGVINNAGIAIPGPLQIVSIDDYKRQFDINVFGMIRVTQAFLPLLGMRKGHSAEPGRIVNISSLAGKVGFPFLSPYTGSKFAMEGISSSLRRELEPFGIKVIVIGPGSIRTPIWNKNEATQAISMIEGTPYLRNASVFGKMMSKAAKTGMDVEVLTASIVRVFEKKNPANRYGFLKKQFSWFLLKYFITEKMMDRYFAKLFKD